jgi:hypothetical protein
VLARSFVATASAVAALAAAGIASAEPGTDAAGKPAAAESSATPAPEPQRRGADPIRPPPLHAAFAQYGVAINALVNAAPGAACGTSVRPASGSGEAPCILGSGGGLVIRGGYRSPGPWYIGGAYAFAKLDSSNLFRLGIFQQLWAEMRYLPDTGYRASPYVAWGLGGVAYGNEWGIETGGAMAFGGGGLEFEVSRLAVVGLAASYKPTVIVGWKDTAGIQRPTGVAHFFGLELTLEVRTEVGRR